MRSAQTQPALQPRSTAASAACRAAASLFADCTGVLRVAVILQAIPEAVRLGMAAGNINVSSLVSDTYELNESTRAALEAQAAAAKEEQIRKKARSVVVPTNDL